MRNIRLLYNATVREQRSEWAQFESIARVQPAVTVVETGLGVLRLLVDAESDAAVLSALAPLKGAAGRLGFAELRVVGDMDFPCFLEPVAALNQG